jgi:hypothetical protein
LSSYIEGSTKIDDLNSTSIALISGSLALADLGITAGIITNQVEYH